MKLSYDMDSPFTGNRTVIKEYIEEAADFLLLDMDTGYTTMQNFFNKKIWRDSGKNVEEIEQYANALLEDMHSDLRPYAKWIDEQLWVLIQTYYEDKDGNSVFLSPIVENGNIRWKVSQAKSDTKEQEPTESVTTLYEKFGEAYDISNNLINKLVLDSESLTQTEEE